MPKKHRQLAAIVFTDIVGYSKLMREDEQKASEMRTRHREVFDKLTPEYGGKILQYYGDGTLSIFQSSVAAVECLVEMQRAFQKDPAIPLRIGIHSGDITFSSEEVFGDGLNIASRIEASCIPGGIFISGKVYDDIKNHSSLKTKSVGQFKFKGLDEYVELYALDCEGLIVPTDPKLPHLTDSKAKILTVNSNISGSNGTSPGYGKKLYELALGLVAVLLLFYVGNNLLNKTTVDMPSAMSMPVPVSIAVLPFSNFSENNEDDYFSNGITEDILTLLSNIKDFRVISRTSVMQYRDTEKSIKEIGEELNATHILEGSVRKSDNKVRIVAQLIDARSDTHLWADTYDREMTEIFAVQSEVAEQIAGTLKTELSPEDCQNIQRNPTDNLQAYEYYLKGRKYYEAYNKADNNIAIELFQKAINTDSMFALSYAGLGDALSQKANYGSEDIGLLDEANKMSKKAIAIDQNCSEGYKALGLSYHYMGKTEMALDAYNQAVKINPNNDMAISNIALISKDKGDFAEGIKWSKKALELNPQQPMSFMRLSELYQAVGMDDYAQSVLAKGIEYYPQNEDLNFSLGELYLKMNHFDDVWEKADQMDRMGSNSPSAYVLRGKAAFYERDYIEAKNYFLKAKDLLDMMDHSKHSWDIDINLAFIDWKLEPEAISFPKLQRFLAQFEQKEMIHPKIQNEIMIATIYSALNDNKKAIVYLTQAADNGFLDYKMLENNPILDNLRKNDDFIKFSEEIEQKAEKIQEQITDDIS